MSQAKPPGYKHTCFKCSKEFTTQHYLETDKATCDECFKELLKINTVEGYYRFIAQRPTIEEE